MNCKLTALMGAAAGAAAGHAFNKPLGRNMPTPAYLLQAATFVVSCVCVCVTPLLLTLLMSYLC